eukprot:2009426-Pyramimonas_sp.AAC.1
MRAEMAVLCLWMCLLDVRYDQLIFFNGKVRNVGDIGAYNSEYRNVTKEVPEVADALNQDRCVPIAGGEA